MNPTRTRAAKPQDGPSLLYDQYMYLLNIGPEILYLVFQVCCQELLTKVLANHHLFFCYVKGKNEQSSLYSRFCVF